MSNVNFLKKVPLSIRACYWYSFLLCAGVMSFAIYLQTFLLVAPCPLCELQRLFFLLIGFTSFFAALVKPKRPGIVTFSSLIIVFALLGALLAGHQLWLETHPPAVASSCTMGLSYLLSALPLTEALKIAIMGTGDCAVVTWRLWGMSIPVWSLITFIILGLLGIYQLRTLKQL